MENETNELKKPISMRLSNEGLTLIDSLGRKMGVNRTAVIEIAIRQMAEREKVAATKQEAAV